MSNSSIWPIDSTLSSAITLGQNGPGNDDNEGLLRIPQSSNVNEASGGESYLFAEMQSMYSEAPADWTR